MKFIAHLCCCAVQAQEQFLKSIKIDFKQREKCLSLQQLFHWFYSARYCFLFLMKSTHFHKYVHNFFIYLSVVFCDPLHCDLSSSMCNLLWAKESTSLRCCLETTFLFFSVTILSLLYFHFFWVIVVASQVDSGNVMWSS